MNEISGVVEATEYQGSYVKVTIDVGGDVFVANVSDADYFAEPVDRGDAVTASWAQADVHMLSKLDTGRCGRSLRERDATERRRYCRPYRSRGMSERALRVQGASVRWRVPRRLTEDGLTLGRQDGEVDMTDIDMIANRTGAGMALAYRSGETTPAEHRRVPACPDRGRARRQHLHHGHGGAGACRGEGRDGAIPRRRPLSALDGVPVAWKDLIDIAGAPTTAGSRYFSGGPVKTADLACAANAAAAGMVTMGKLNMTEMAYSGLGLNPHYGTPLNPNDRKTPRSPGGSSSGSGAAVAARLVPCAIGTDTGGSVRIPSAFNGVVGYKTSCGRIDTTGMFPLARTYDTIGPLARSVEDCILLDRALRGAISAEASAQRSSRTDPAVPRPMSS